MSSNSWAVHYVTAAALYGQQQWRAAREWAAEEEEVTPEDSAGARVSPTNEVTNSLDALALIHDELANNEDVTMDEEVSQGFEEALQSFWAVDDELEAILAGDAEGQFNLSQQLGQRTAGPPTSNTEVELEEVFMERGITDTSLTVKMEASAGPLLLEDAESSVMSSLSSQLSDIAAHPGYPFWQYRRTTHGAPIMLPEPHPEIPPGDGEDDLYLLGERFQMDYVITRAMEAIGDTGVTANIYRLHCFSERKREVQQEHQWLSCLADFLTSEWQQHYGEEKQLRA